MTLVDIDTNDGLSAARNDGAQAASGDVVRSLDYDIAVK